MKKFFYTSLLMLVSHMTLVAQNPADLLKTPAVAETQNVQSELLEFPEEALTKSMMSSLSKQGKSLGVINSDGSIYIVGAATTARPSNMSGFINSRNNAYAIAELTAKMNLLRMAGESITSGRGFQMLEDIIEGEDPDAKKTATMLDKAVKIADKSLDKALSELGVSESEIASMNESQKKAAYQQEFNQTIRSLVAGMVHGCSVVRIAEGESGGDDYQVAVCVKYSPEFQSMAAAMKNGLISSVPVGAAKNSREKIMEMSATDLIYKLGTWITYDNNGKMVVYGFGQQEVRETGSRQSAAISRASSQARLQAISNIKNFVAEDLVAKESQSSVEKLKEYADGTNAYFSQQKWQQAVTAKETTLNISTEQVRTWRANHPISNTMVVGFVVAWTVDNTIRAGQLKQQLNNNLNTSGAQTISSPRQQTTKGQIVITGSDEDL